MTGNEYRIQYMTGNEFERPNRVPLDNEGANENSFSYRLIVNL